MSEYEPLEEDYVPDIDKMQDLVSEGRLEIFLPYAQLPLKVNSIALVIEPGTGRAKLVVHAEEPF